MPLIPSDNRNDRARRDDDGTSVATPEVMQFHSDALDDDNELQVMNLNGVESISSPYKFTVELASTNRGIDLNEILKEPAWVSIKQGVRTPGSDERSTVVHRVHGVITSIRQTGREMEWIKYEAVLEPRLSRARLAHNSRIFQDLNVPDLVKKVLDEYGIDIEDKLAEDHPKREFIVQYEESDLDFIHRWMEHEGIFYYFTQDEEKETLVLADTPENYSAMPGDNQFRFRPVGDSGRSDSDDSEDADNDWFREELVTALTCNVNHMPKEVILNDYNWRTPADQLECKATVDEDGHGVVYEYNNHYKNLDEGRHLAEIRADEIACRKQVFIGTSECRGFRAGMVFELKQPQSDDESARNGLNDDFYQEYLITAVMHSASQTLALGSRMISGATYYNTFEAIPKSGRTFRPKCETHWPSIKGVMHAKVDGPDDDSDYAQIDEAGRYKVKFPLDRQGDEDGKASKWVRKSETYAGPNQGMHFPLLKGSEVLVTYIDGDPDRPIISGALYNEQTTNIVSEENHTLNKIVTPIGNTLILEDTVDAPQISIYTTEMKNKIFLDGSVDIEKIEFTNNKNIIQIDARSGDEFILLKTEVNNTYIRLGTGIGENGGGDDGIKINTGGDYRLGVSGKGTIFFGKTYNLRIGEDADIYIGGEKTEVVAGAKAESFFDNSAKLTIGAKAEAQISAEAKIAMSASVKATLGADFEVAHGIKVKYDKSKTFDIDKDDWNHKCLKKWDVQAVGECKIDSLSDKIILDALTGIVLQCGQSKIELTQQGIKLKHGQSQVVLDASSVRGKGTNAELKGTASLTTKGGSGQQNN
jgi:type VI secretion system secreted protein VgrG